MACQQRAPVASILIDGTSYQLPERDVSQAAKLNLAIFHHLLIVIYGELESRIPGVRTSARVHLLKDPHLDDFGKPVSVLWRTAGLSESKWNLAGTAYKVENPLSTEDGQWDPPGPGMPPHLWVAAHVPIKNLLGLQRSQIESQTAKTEITNKP